MHDQIIQTRIQSLTPEYREFVLSDFAQTAATTFGQRLGLDEDQLIAFENGIALWLLFFFSRDELVTYIAEEFEIAPSVADLTVTAIIEALPDDLTAAMKKTYLELNEGGEGDTQDATPISKENLLSDIAETQAQLDAIQPIRTMEGDAAAVQAEDGAPVHKSNQEHIFGQRPVLGETPNYQQSNEASEQTVQTPEQDGGGRWESEKSS